MINNTSPACFLSQSCGMIRNIIINNSFPSEIFFQKFAHYIWKHMSSDVGIAYMYNPYRMIHFGNLFPKTVQTTIRVYYNIFHSIFKQRRHRIGHWNKSHEPFHRRTCIDRTGIVVTLCLIRNYILRIYHGKSLH